MFFLLRMAFWLGLVLVLLPNDDDQADATKGVDAMTAATAAAAAMSDMSQFCTRQPAACEIGGKAAHAIGERAQSGARKVYQFITDQKREDTREPEHTGSIGPVQAASQNTLTAQDLAIEWRMPAEASAGG